MSQEKQMQAAIERLQTIESKLNVLVGGQLVGVLEETEGVGFTELDERITRIETLIDNLTHNLKAILAAQEVLRGKLDRNGEALDQLLKMLVPAKE